MSQLQVEKTSDIVEKENSLWLLNYLFGEMDPSVVHVEQPREEKMISQQEAAMKQLKAFFQDAKAGLGTNTNEFKKKKVEFITQFISMIGPVLRPLKNGKIATQDSESVRELKRIFRNFSFKSKMQYITLYEKHWKRNMSRENRIQIMEKICLDSLEEMKNQEFERTSGEEKKHKPTAKTVKPRPSSMNTLFLVLMDNHTFKNCDGITADFQRMYEQLTPHISARMAEVRLLRSMLKQVNASELKPDSRTKYRQWVNDRLADIYDNQNARE
jgi:hypothetical protein